MSGSQQLLLGTGVSAVAANYIEDVFSTWLYTGNGSTQVINSGVDLAAKGGLVWFKSRNNSTFANSPNCLTDSVTGFSKYLISEQTQFQQNWGADGPVPKSYGFDLPINGSVPYTNYLTGSTYVAWTFAKQPKFFDVVTYTGNGGSQTISHNLGSTPGCIIIKKLDSTTFNAGWAVYHRSLTNPNNYYLVLNTTAAQTNYGGPFISSVSSTSFTVDGTSGLLGLNGSQYVAYLFAHDAGGFGLTGTDNVISCGSFTANGGNDVSTTLGWEPQYLLIKSSSSAGSWLIGDTMRGLIAGSATASDDATLFAQLSDAESLSRIAVPTATGFTTGFSGTATYIYIAIRRGPMKTPTTGTSVFAPITYTGTGATRAITSPGFPVDFVESKTRNATYNDGWFDRLRGATKKLSAVSTDAEITQSDSLTGFDSMTGYSLGADASGGSVNESSINYVNWAFRRAPGFFDVVCYTGTGSNASISHNLGVAPELIIVKRRNTADIWPVYSQAVGNTQYLRLQGDNPAGTFNVWQNTNPTASVFYVSTDTTVNASGSTYVAYLFATVAGVSKVGSYTGTGALQTINCGFTGGARFVLIKRTDSTGDWFVYDSARGISSGSDPYLLMNTADAEVTGTNYVDTTSVGFQVTAAAPAGLNASGGSYIFLAIS